ncbi:MAG: hypothetical protein GQ579_09515 [Bacteroidales bacterium]|nr:hypothetical protein [Bacteroidales bacterium]
MIPMESIGYKPGAGDVIGRLKSLYERKAGDRVFADFQIPSLTMDQFRADHAEGYTSYPDPHERARFWDSLLKEKVLCEDDQIPSAYLSEFDQGLYGALIGGEIQFLNDPGTGWISSMVKPMIEDLTQFQLRPFEESHPWFSKYLHQLEVFSSVSENRFGLSHFILIDSLNFVFELVGATKTYLNLFEAPETVREIIDFAFDLNVRVQEAFFDNTSSFLGGTFSNMVQWIPGRVISESVDPFHMTSVEDYEQWGEANVQRMFNHFDGGVLHIHSNGRHLLNAVSRLEGLKAIALLDEKDNPLAFDVLPEMKKRVGDVPLVISVNEDKFEHHLNRNTLPGGVFYVVKSTKNVDEVNRIMEGVRKYRID